MKKDIKYLLKLEEKLSTISKTKREEIVSKYRTIIDSEKASQRRIVDILNDLGTPEEVAAREIEIIKNSRFFTRTINLMKIKLAKEELEQEVTDNVVVVDVKKKSKKNIEKTKEELAEKEAIIKEIEYSKNEKKEEKKRLKDEKKALKLAKKEEKLKLKEEKKKEAKKNSKSKKKSKSKKTKVKRTIKWYIKTTFEKIKNSFKRKSKVEKAIDKVEEETSEVIENVVETVTENKIFEPKKKRAIRITLRVLSIILIILILFIFLWASVLFIASAFAILDGIKVYGVTLGLFGIMLLLLWIILVLYRTIFKKKKFTLFWIISIVTIIVLIALGVAYTIRQFYKIEKVDDISIKYNMATFYEKYTLGSSKKKTYISFNCNYKTKYVVEYDDKLINTVKIEAKYYENYYDIYAKKTTNNIYISLKEDSRDRLSSYIDDLKENKVFDSKELNRYTLKITMNEADKDRVIILSK